VANGEGRAKKEAEQLAAREALRRLRPAADSTTPPEARAPSVDLDDA